MGKIYADDELSKIVFSDNETLKALQKKKISLQKKSVQLVDEKLYDINKKSEIMKNIKDNEFGQILEKLTELFNMYKLKRTTRVIETLEEFIEAMLIGITLYDRIFELTLEKGEESNLKKDCFNTFKENLIKFKKTASKIKKYEYKESFATASKINEFQLEIQKLRNEKEELSKKINDFASQHLSQIFKDWGEFNSILKDKGILKTVAELSATQEAFEKLDEFDTGETKQKLNEIFVESSKKLEVYLEDVKTFHLEGNFDKQNSIKKNLEELIENFSDDDDIIYILLHFQWANILINNNIMKYEQIDAEHSGTMNISDSLGSLKNAVLKHYFGEDDGENLSYNNGIKIQKKKDGNEAEKENPFKEFLSTHDDAIFYDLLLLEAGENNFKTFNELKSTKDSFFKNGDNNYYGPFNIIKGKGPMRFNFTCSVDDVIKIANAVQCMKVLKKSGGNKNLLSYINSSSEYKEEGKMNFSLKENFLNQIEDQRDIFERTDEICSSLIENGGKISTVSAKEMSMFFEILNQFPDEKMKDNAGYLLSKEEFFLNCLAYFENSKKEGLNECLTYLIDKMEQIIKSFENKKSEFKDLQIEDKRITDFETFIKNLNLKDEDRPKGINMEEILKENQVRDIEVLEKAKKWQQNFIDFFNFSDINEKFAMRKEEAEKNRLKKKEKNEEAKKALTIDESFLEKTEKNKNLQANESASSEGNESASSEDSGNASSEDSGNASSEDSGNASSEDSGNASSEDSGNASSEDSGNASSEDSGNALNEDSENALNEDNENASNEDNENASNEDNENALNEDNENASNKDNENALNEDNENASNEENENASSEENEIKTWENTLKASQKEIISSNENAVIKSESAKLSEKEKKINSLINSLNKLEDKKEIKIVLQEMEEAVKIYNKKIFEILEKYLENISESDKSKFQKIKTLRNFKTITSSSESNLILENETEKITAEIKIEKEDFKKIAEINKAKKQSIYETIEKYISTIDSKL